MLIRTLSITKPFCKKSDIVEDKTQHEPCSLTQDRNVIAKSIKFWEVGTSDAAAISCKELFPFTPKHSDFICKKDKDEDIFRCSGCRQPIDMSFVAPVPFLVFDISSTFRENIKTLDLLPRITSYVESRRHYVGYILHNCHFLYYNGTPAANPVLERYHGKYIEGDISLLCY